MPSKNNLSSAKDINIIAVCPCCSVYNKLSRGSIKSHRCIECKNLYENKSYKELSNLEVIDFQKRVVEFKSHFKSTLESNELENIVEEKVKPYNIEKVKTLLLKRGNDIAVMNFLSKVERRVEETNVKMTHTPSKSDTTLKSSKQDQNIDLMNKAIEILYRKSKELTIKSDTLKFDM